MSLSETRGLISDYQQEAQNKEEKERKEEGRGKKGKEEERRWQRMVEEYKGSEKVENSRETQA